VISAVGLMLVGCGGSGEYGAVDQRTGLFGTARITPAISGGHTVCGPPKLPREDLVLATCERVARAHVERREVDEGSEQLARQGRQAGICG
jgi:hypothetical protein